MKGIVVTGTGEVSAAPDIATLTLGVETTAGTVAEAAAAQATAANRLIERLLSAGVARLDIQTAGLSVTPQWEHRPNGPAVISGYSASNTLRVTLRELSRAGEVIDAAVGAAGDAGRVQGIAYGFSNPAPLLEQARLAAAKDARAKARTLAEGAGVRLGKVLSVTEGAPAGDRPQPRFKEMALAAASTPVEPGSSSLSVAVTIRFGIR